MASASIGLSFDEMVAIYNACDSSYDGIFFTAVKTTGIYCRPSCRSKQPNRENVTFYQTPEEAESAGFRACKRCRPDKLHFDPKKDLVTHAKDYMDQHYKEKLTLEQIARHVGASSYYLGRLFKQEISETPRAYLEKLRVERAEHLLKTTSLPILDVCYESGFQNPSSFYQAFRRWKPYRPGQYRKGVSDDL